MKVRYTAQLNSEEPVETVMELEELPPMAARELRDHGLEALLKDYRFWRIPAGQVWWWVREVES